MIYIVYLKHKEPDYVRIYKEDLLDEGYIILNENPKHTEGYMIEYMFEDIQDCIESEFSKELCYLDENTIIIKGTKPHNRHWVTDIFEYYPNFTINKILFNATLNKTFIIYSHKDDKVYEEEI